MTGDMVTDSDQLMGVILMGGGQQWLPASPDAFVWLRLTQLDCAVAGVGQKMWLTLPNLIVALRER